MFKVGDRVRVTKKFLDGGPFIFDDGSLFSKLEKEIGIIVEDVEEVMPGFYDVQHYAVDFIIDGVLYAGDYLFDDIELVGE